jgi:hypothetical protein
MEAPMLQININTKQELIKLIQSSDIRQVIARDIHVPDDLNEMKKSAIQLMKSKKSITVFVVAS